MATFGRSEHHFWLVCLWSIFGWIAYTPTHTKRILNTLGTGYWVHWALNTWAKYNIHRISKTFRSVRWLYEFNSKLMNCSFNFGFHFRFGKHTTNTQTPTSEKKLHFILNWMRLFDGLLFPSLINWIPFGCSLFGEPIEKFPIAMKSESAMNQWWDWIKAPEVEQFTSPQIVLRQESGFFICQIHSIN